MITTLLVLGSALYRKRMEKHIIYIYVYICNTWLLVIIIDLLNNCYSVVHITESNNFISCIFYLGSIMRTRLLCWQLSIIRWIEAKIEFLIICIFITDNWRYQELEITFFIELDNVFFNVRCRAADLNFLEMMMR